MPKTGYPDPTTSRTPSHRRRPRSAPSALAALVALALAVAVPAPAAAGPPGRPGSLVSVAPTTVRLTPTIPLPGRAWAVTYRSTSATGAPIVVSGTVLLPAGAWFGHGPRPLVTYAVGTHGLGDQCAPSRRLAEGTEAELLLINQALGRGWAVAVTDYEGLGTPGPHTYLVAPAQGNAVLDMARAALALPDAGLSPDAPVGIWVFSQGGLSAAAAAERADDYAPDLDVRAVAAGGVPADLAEVFAEVRDRAGSTGVFVALTTGHDAAYPGLDLRGRLSAEGQAFYDDIRDDCIDQIGAKGSAFTPAQVAPADLLTAGPGGTRIAQSRVGGDAPDFPRSSTTAPPTRPCRSARAGTCATTGARVGVRSATPSSP